jgi:hypothetical protein
MALLALKLFRIPGRFQSERNGQGSDGRSADQEPDNAGLMPPHQKELCTLTLAQAVSACARVAINREVDRADMVFLQEEY